MYALGIEVVVVMLLLLPEERRVLRVAEKRGVHGSQGLGFLREKYSRNGREIGAGATLLITRWIRALLATGAIRYLSSPHKGN